MTSEILVMNGVAAGGIATQLIKRALWLLAADLSIDLGEIKLFFIQIPNGNSKSKNFCCSSCVDGRRGQIVLRRDPA